MDLPVLKDCAAARVGMDRASIGMSSGDATAMHRLSQIRASHRPRDDVISVARIHGGVAIAVKHDGRDLAAFAKERNVARVQRIPKVTLPHDDERRWKVVGGPTGQSRMNAREGVEMRRKLRADVREIKAFLRANIGRADR
jgi:hypothetical protein